MGETREGGGVRYYLELTAHSCIQLYQNGNHVCSVCFNPRVKAPRTYAPVRGAYLRIQRHRTRPGLAIAQLPPAWKPA